MKVVMRYVFTVYELVGLVDQMVMQLAHLLPNILLSKADRHAGHKANKYRHLSGIWTRLGSPELLLCFLGGSWIPTRRRRRRRDT
jgi:hypothetical protein